MKSEETEIVETYKVNIKLPPFWIERPDIWFHQVEAQFLINNIKTENTKFNYLIAQLEPKYVENIWDIITSKEINKYSEAKERLLRIFKDGESKRIRKLLSGIELGDLKPSQLLQKLRSLATEDLSIKFLKTLWLEKLPQAIQQILIISKEELDKLAVMADRIAELNPKTEIYEAAKPENETKMLFKKIESLEQKIESMKMEHHGRSRDRSSRDYRYNARSRSRSKGGYNPKGKFCYFHYRYGKNCLPGKCKKPCEWFNAGKLQPAVSGATHSAAGQNIRRNSLTKKTGMRFLVDSGADISLIPYEGKLGTTLNDFKLYAANGTEISTYGTQILSLDLGLRRQFQWPFVIAKTNRGILGADFRNNFKLILDINRRQLIDGITNLTIKGDICSISEETFSSYRTTSNFSKLLANYPDITRPNVGIMKANHDVKHFIITKGPPVFSRARPLDPKRLNEAKQEFQFMLEHGIIRPSKSQWASPLHLVTKKDGTLRPCGDYRKLNSQTLPDRYPIPRLEDFQHILTLKYSRGVLFDEEEEDFDELDDDNFSDDEEYIPHCSDSEQEEDDEQEPHQDSTYFFGRDKMTKWKKEEWRTSRVRTRAINIITHLPCSKQFGKNTPTPLEAFLKFISIDIIKKIVEYTNIFIETIRPNYSRERDCRNTDENEIRCLLGLIIIIGKNRASHLHFKEIWNANGTGIEICRAAMAYERFLFLLRVIRFDNVLTRQIRRDNDKFAALREIFEMFVANCKQIYSPGEYLTIDEKLIPFRGKCNFRQYIPNKPAKYGLKIYMMSDAHTFYTVNMEPYVGNNRGPFYKSNASDDVVKRLVEPVSGTKRNITTDNWYTSFPLAQSLLTEHNLTLVGTLKKNKKEIPVEFLPNRNRPIFSSFLASMKIQLLYHMSPRNQNQLSYCQQCTQQ
ncbi:hypothetical protein LAZ67_7002533 [Cordylochernes scorpioides]|uniref:Peptidase A2 domain-containing protein n=1 Tax=Cordylochernes scorpioides TaxID=51811 RepID=A0ABY6KNT6_9ARAC|nr:hypothetical protein LAZ67_7002533 [Cordylochernes scorpioides]